MNLNSIEKKLAADYSDYGFPACLRPFIGENYNGTLIITSNLVLNKDSSLSKTDTPFDLYEDPHRFYSGSTLSDSQEKEIDVSKLAEDINNGMKENAILNKSSVYPAATGLAVGTLSGLGLLLGGVLSAAALAIGTTSAIIAKKNNQNKFDFSKLAEDISNPLKKAGCTINDIAIHRFFLRPQVVSGNFMRENDFLFNNGYYKKDDHRYSILMLRNIINSLCPQNIIFSSNILANIIAEDFVEEFGESFESFTQKRGILSDLNLTWDVCQKEIINILKDNDVSGQKRLRLLSEALCQTVNQIRQNNFIFSKIYNSNEFKNSTLPITARELEEQTKQLYIISDSIRLLVEEYKDRLKNRGTGKRNLSQEQLERRREIGRMKKPRKQKTT